MPSTVPAAPRPQQVVKCFANPSEAPARSRNVCMFAALPASQDLERPLQIIAIFSSPALPLPSFLFSTNCHETFPFGTISSLSFLFSTCKCKFAANSHPHQLLPLLIHLPFSCASITNACILIMALFSCSVRCAFLPKVSLTKSSHSFASVQCILFFSSTAHQ